MPKDDTSAPDASQDNIASQMASIIYRLDQILRDTILRRLDLTYIHFRVLQYLYATDGRQIGEIAAYQGPFLHLVYDPA